MLKKVRQQLREWNHVRLHRRRFKQPGSLTKSYPPKHVIRVKHGLDVDVIKYFGARSPIDPTSITFPACAEPVISIIISAYGKPEYTLRCLRSIALYPPSVPFEVLVIEDASGDLQATQLRQVTGLIYIENETNLGYLRSNNKAVTLSKGEYIHLLNNDTQVLPYAIDALFDLCRSKEKSLIGSKLIYPDGTLQEAGGIVWADASAWNYGRNDHPARWQYNYVRTADYCSGASILLRRSTWDELGGYDEWFLPAYCEDSDLAFRVRAAGGEVYYQPFSVVIHDEGVSHGTSVEGGVKKWQVENTRKLHERWGGVMRRDGYDCDPKNLIKARDRARFKKTVLVIDHYLPQPDRDAGSRTMISFMEALQDAGCIVKFWSDNLRAHPDYVDQMISRGIEILVAPEVSSFAAWMKTYGSGIDLFFLSRPLVAKNYIHTLRREPGKKVIYYGHDLHFARMEMQAKIAGQSVAMSHIRKMRALEIELWQQSDISLYPSEEEAVAARLLCPQAHIDSINAYCLTPRQVDDGLREAQTDLASLLFVAGFKHPPNEDAAVWFVQQVLPLILRERPDVKLHLVGSEPTTKVKSLSGPSVVVTGAVSSEQLAAYYRQACVAVVPLRFGAGVKLKVLEAMAERVPLVTTPVGGQGLGDASFLCVAENPVAFAHEVLALLADKSARDALAERQAHFIEQRYSRSALADVFQALISD